jgi:hypothetical protein
MYYNTLFWGATTRMSPLVGGYPVYTSNAPTGWTRATCSAANAAGLGSGYCLTGGTPDSSNFGHAITGNKYDFESQQNIRIVPLTGCVW